jgi:predicted Holliday junction resolvase-like endonuclease
MTANTVVALGLAIAAAVVLILAILLLWQSDRRHLQSTIEVLLESGDAEVEAARKDSVDKSRSTLKGKIAEQLAPLFPGFPYLPADARFLGSPIDYIVFSGISNLSGHPSSVEDLEIVLLEVKQGSSALTQLQKAVATCVEEGKVRFEITRVDEDGTVTLQTWRPKRLKKESTGIPLPGRP